MIAQHIATLRAVRVRIWRYDRSMDHLSERPSRLAQPAVGECCHNTNRGDLIGRRGIANYYAKHRQRTDPRLYCEIDKMRVSKDQRCPECHAWVVRVALFTHKK